ncbi:MULTISPECIES: peptide chain release factor 3 [unclassified Haematospirillum]|uniref:peptide chain release factor 3 n=1 Tax=unclassified Haematospirillum TaxID=2622088 RepID=UPI0014388DAB|nr:MULTISPECIES: peptide chain release factor 3 [unclassified Haematospirillum]NKD54385.1 peptide chain release factor 3 [Haematospirillum sp. H4890]NKD74428.1 peptide chain release factor 3 [Haematospirillum sp. H4485]NKD86901.1 peptide chain release factor 3 [Haematospirillum sp. 15-248]
MSNLSHAVSRRRTFAIISHPDAGKTTLTEKLLLFGGAIQVAGAVKARGEQRRAHSDWMKVERERGISVASSVMTFDYADCTFNLLDTPGHEDFSEDTYRVLTAVDSAVMVIDAAKGIEEQTRKLFEVCRLRDVPIMTFINKLDREGQDPFHLLDEIEQSLALDVTPASWPIGMGKAFLGCYDLWKDQLILMERSKGGMPGLGASCTGLDDPELDRQLPALAVEALRHDVEMARAFCKPFDIQAYREGHMTPVFFGSAVNNFGVRELLDGLASQAPPPRPQPCVERPIMPTEPHVTGVVFKVQANMDPRHRDRIAFVRLASGHFKRGMKLKHVRSGKIMTMHNPVMFLAQDRGLAEEAFPGDIIGVPNHGNLAIGDALTEGEELHFTGIPRFAPELLQKVRPHDPLRAKHLSKALLQLAEEGAARVFKPRFGADWIVGVVGALQFEVMADRIRTEYEVPVVFEPTPLYTARWVESTDPVALKKMIDANQASIADDHEDQPVFLARNAWHLDRTAEDNPDVRFLKIKG